MASRLPEFSHQARADECWASMLPLGVPAAPHAAGNITHKIGLTGAITCITEHMEITHVLNSSDAHPSTPWFLSADRDVSASQPTQGQESATIDLTRTESWIQGEQLILCKVTYFFFNIYITLSVILSLIF